MVRESLIDLHSHVLPGIDDGAGSLEEAITMARRARDDGVTTIVATPHSSDLVPGLDLGQVALTLSELKVALEDQGIALELLYGLENYMAPDLAQAAEREPGLSLAQSNCMLVELPLQQYPIYTEQVLFELQLRGKQPILAHPERNAALQRDPSLLQRLVERGVLGQVTAASLLGHFGGKARSAAEEFVARRLVHIIATDAHSPDGARSPLLSHAVAAAARLIGEEAARGMVTTIPQALLTGAPVAVEPPLEALRRRSLAFWRIWR